MAASAEEKQLAQLEETYAFRAHDAVVDFLKKHPFLHPILLEAPQQIARYFPDSPLFLEIDIDPEGTGEPNLLLLIGIRLDADEAVTQLNKFDEGWWIRRVGDTRGMLIIHIEFQ